MQDRRLTIIVTAAASVFLGATGRHVMVLLRLLLLPLPPPPPPTWRTRCEDERDTAFAAQTRQRYCSRPIVAVGDSLPKLCRDRPRSACRALFVSASVGRS